MALRPRVILGISGASGAALGQRILELLAAGGCETHLVVTRNAERTIAHEIGPTALERLRGIADCVHSIENVGATIASGSFRTAGMIVAPCSMRTLSAIAGSMADNLLVRAADVHLKERRKLVLLARESPLHLGHIRAMLAATEMGAVIAPPIPAFYFKPETVSDIIDQTARRTVDLLGSAMPAAAEPWQGLS
jgi:4-hydroxy-3-polyprenylbenzoate decarboxylase